MRLRLAMSVSGRIFEKNLQDPDTLWERRLGDLCSFFSRRRS